MGVIRKAEVAYPTGAPGPCSRLLMETELLICFCYFVCMILVALCFSLCVSVFNVWSLSLGYILLIAAIALVPLITLTVSSFFCLFTAILNLNYSLPQIKL